ncbi:MAG: PilZ domain-containing protein [Desulfobacterales bacterium]|nr:PilZ domain-containing protein [Desulfobacterales bacterium]
MESSERRIVERFDLEIPARLRIMAADETVDEIELRTENISCGGAFFRTPTPLPEGTDVRIDLVLNLDRIKTLKTRVGNVHIELTGTVNRSEASGMSVCFHPEYSIRPLEGEFKT